jgi:hypothetical protein
MPTASDIDALLAFLPGFSDPGRRFIRMAETGSPAVAIGYDYDVEAFFRIASSECWMDYDYDPRQAVALLEDTRAIAEADFSVLRALLTASVRGERFSDGWWGSLLTEGKLQAILQRLAELRNDPGDMLELDRGSDQRRGR